jgi:hypothetical protein
MGIFQDGRSIVFINPSRSDFVAGFNPFKGDSSDISTQVSRRIDATIRPWGITNTNDMPTFERTCRALFHFMIESGETLPNAAKLLSFSERQLRDYALRCVTDPYAASLWRELQNVSARDWRDYVLSTENRLARFLSSTAIRRFMGLAEHTLNLEKAMNEGQIILVNLGFSDCLPTDAARVFASLLINEFFETAMRRSNRAADKPPKPFTLYLDEFQEYITDDVAAMLDQVRKGGLQLVLAHQHLGHFSDNPRLKKSVLTNARIRAVFGGLDFEDASVFGNEMFLPDLNSRQIKKAYYHTVHVYREEERSQVTRGTTHGTTWSSSSSHGSGSSFSSSESSGAGESSGGATMFPPGEPTEGWFTESAGSSTFSSSGTSQSESEFSSESESTGGSESETNSVTTGPVFVPIPIKELGSETEWGREEKLSKVAELLKFQQQRHCFIKIDRSPTQPLRVPDVSTPNVEPETLLEYERMLHARYGSLSASAVDLLLAQNERDFIARALGLPPVERQSEPNSSHTVPGEATAPTGAGPDDDYY